MVKETATYSRDTSGEQSSTSRDLLVNYNNLIKGLVQFFSNLGGNGLISSTELKRGTGATLSIGASTIFFDGVGEDVAAVPAQAFGSLGTIPIAKWGIIAVVRKTGGVVSFLSGAANYTTGYATEQEAITALPSAPADGVIVGYLTIKAGDTTTWVAGTSSLAGGTNGNPAAITNYYKSQAIFGNLEGDAHAIGDLEGVVISV